jgi:hypothetical protein
MFLEDNSSIFSMLNYFYLPPAFAQLDGSGNMLEWVKSVPFVINVKSLVQVGAEVPVRSLLCMAAKALMQTPEMQANAMMRANEFVAIKALRKGEVVR